jgi:hypothetical protein
MASITSIITIIVALAFISKSISAVASDLKISKILLTE